MKSPAASRLKLNPPLGHLPALQYLLPQQLEVDSSYQRSIESAASQTLIRRIAQHWNWDLCQPLVVSRRADGALYVIDGQHRLEAARLRGDIAQLPAVVVSYASSADEAASFVHLNQQRRPLSKLEVFKAAVASGDPESCAIVAAIEAAGLALAPHTNPDAWQPGMIANIGGIERVWRVDGERVARHALKALAQGFAGQVLRYAGSLFPRIAAVCAIELKGSDEFPGDLWDSFVDMIGGGSQAEWRQDIARQRLADPNLNYAAASARAFTAAWEELLTAFFDEDEPAVAA